MATITKDQIARILTGANTADTPVAYTIGATVQSSASLFALGRRDAKQAVRVLREVGQVERVDSIIRGWKF